MPAFDSLVIGDSIELLGQPGGTPSVNPNCLNAKFRLNPGGDLGSPNPTAAQVLTMLTDGSRPLGDRSENRQITLPVTIVAPDFVTLAAAREELMKILDRPEGFTLTWTRDPATNPGNVSLPLVFDCLRAAQTTRGFGGADGFSRYPVEKLTLTIPALPFARSDLPVTPPVLTPLSGQPTPASPVTIETFATTGGQAQWAVSSTATVGTTSGFWDPGIAPLSAPSGALGVPATFTRSSVGPFNLTGLPVLSVWVGLGTAFYSTWHSGNLIFAVTLSDGTHSFKFSVTRRMNASNNPLAPVWRQIHIPIPQSIPTFNYSAVTGYTIQVTNRGNPSLRYTKLYLNNIVANPQTLQQNTSVKGQFYTIPGVQGTAHTVPQFQFTQSPGATNSVTLKLPGPGGTNQQWQAPAGVSTIDCTVTAPGGMGGKRTTSGIGGGGGGGETAREATLAVTALAMYTYSLGQTGFASVGGSDAFFTGDVVTVRAHRGSSVADNTNTGGTGGSGSTNTIHFSGGNGASGPSTSGGGGSAASAAAVGNNASGSTGGAALAGFGKGANGTAAGGATGKNGGSPGGGGSGATGTTINPNIGWAGGLGGGGQILVVYTVAVVAFSTLIVHMPPAQAPDNFYPLIPLDATDTPDGSIEYPVPQLIPGQPAEYAGSYSVILVGVFANPGNSRNLTIQFNQYEYTGGPVYSATLTRNNVVPNTDTDGLSGRNGVLLMGDLTLPIRALPDDNTTAVFTLTVTSTNTADRFSDCITCDSMGQTVIINIAAANAYAQFNIDAPKPQFPVGLVTGSDFDRSAAVSVLPDTPIISGGPMLLNPGDNKLLAYCVEGAPALGFSYFPAWYFDRLPV